MNYQPTGADWRKQSAGMDIDIRPYINGSRVEVPNAQLVDKINPADRSDNTPIINGDVALAEEAVASARAAFEGPWGATGPGQRREILLEAARLLREAGPELALLDSVEMGKPMSSSLGDAHISASFVQYYAEALDKFYGSTAPGDKGFMETQEFVARGVVAAIIPWNFPIINAGMKAGPALAAGNSVILKPSEYGTYSALRFAEIMKEAGLPDGALNVVTGGAKISEALIRSSSVDLVSFTGSTATGAAVMQAAGAEPMKPVMLECGGKSPQILFADAFSDDMAPMISGFIAQTSMWNSGQVCVARSRLLVERSIYDVVIENVAGACAAMKVGHPLSDDTQLGPLAFEEQYHRVLRSIEKGNDSNARLVLDGRDGVSKDGLYLGPTIFADAAAVDDLWRTEIFGPVLAIAPFDDADEALKMANDTDYGLAATVWTRDLSRGARMSEGLNAGTVAVMTRPSPPDGCWAAHSAEPAGQSGFGIEGGVDALKSYSRLKSTQFVY